MAPTVGSPTRRICRRISRYVPADGTQVAGPQARKMWNYLFPGPLVAGFSCFLSMNDIGFLNGRF